MIFNRVRSLKNVRLKKALEKSRLISTFADEIYHPPRALVDKSHINSHEQYRQLYHESIIDPIKFWNKIRDELYFKRSTDCRLEFNFDLDQGDIFSRFMTGAVTNICFNAVDRQILAGKGWNIAFRWQGNFLEDSIDYTYQELYTAVKKAANILKEFGVKKGDRVVIYLPMIFELPVAMLACARIGAIHSVVFAGFSAESLAMRIEDADAKVLITADAFYRGTKLINLREITDNALEILRNKGKEIDHRLIVNHFDRISKSKLPKIDVIDQNFTEIDADWKSKVRSASDECPIEWMDADDPFFILYTSGSTGKPKGVVHSVAGYMLYVYATCKYVFNMGPANDVYWCTADCGWITGHSYVVYGPLMHGITVVLDEGIPTWPDPGRPWYLTDKFQINKLYTAPTAIRQLMAFGDKYVTDYNRGSLELLGTVGEPINPSSWKWYWEVVGNRKCSIVDTYWQTETGGHIISPLPRATPMKPGSACLPFFGIDPVILDEKDCEITGEGEGKLCIRKPWPGLMKTIWNDHKRFESAYFANCKGYYFTGDGARRDKDGYIWITGRVDDLMNVSGHLLSTSEIESALVAHPNVAEAAVVSKSHSVKGQVPYAFVTLNQGIAWTSQLDTDLHNMVRTKISSIATPEHIQPTAALPKTRSGKITRRILRKVAEGDRNADLGDTSTLAEESVLEELWEGRADLIQKGGQFRADG